MASPKQMPRSRSVRRFSADAPRRAIPRNRSRAEHWSEQRPARAGSMVEAVLLDEEPAEVIGLEHRARIAPREMTGAPDRRAERYEAVLLDPEPRPVIRHPDIYKTRRAHVPAAPAARSTPLHLDGESSRIALPGDRGGSLAAWLMVLGALAAAAHYLVL